MGKYESSEPEKLYLECLLTPQQQFVEEAVEISDDQEIEFMSNPVLLRKTAGSILFKFGEYRNYNGQKFFCTPDTQVNVPVLSSMDPVREVSVHLSTPAPGSEEFALYHSAAAVDPSVRIRMFTIAGDDLETMVINNKNKELYDIEDFIMLRLILEQMQFNYSNSALTRANSIDISRCFNQANNVMPSGCTFFMSKGVIKNMSVAVDFGYPGEALKEAIKKFCSQTNTEPVAYDNSNPFKLNPYFSLSIAGDRHMLPATELQPLFRDLTISDIDAEILKKYRLKKIWENVRN